MRNGKNRFLALFLTCAILFSFTSVPAFAAAEGDTLNFTLTARTLDYATGTVGDLISGDTALKSGQFIAAAINMDQTSLGALQLRLKYDNTRLEYLWDYNKEKNKNNKFKFNNKDGSSYALFEQIGAFSISVNGYKGESDAVNFVGSDSEAMGCEVDGELVYVPFRVKEDVESASNCTLFWFDTEDGAVTEAKFYDDEGKNYAYTCVLGAPLVMDVQAPTVSLSISSYKNGAERPLKETDTVRAGEYYVITVNTDAPRVKGFQIPLSLNGELLDFAADYDDPAGIFTNGIARGELTRDFKPPFDSGTQTGGFVDANVVRGDILLLGGAATAAANTSGEEASLIKALVQVKPEAGETDGDVFLASFSDSSDMYLAWATDGNYTPDRGGGIFRTVKNYKLGDVNNDTLITVSDVLVVIDYLLDREIAPQNIMDAADVNKDGTINLDDLVLIIDCILDRVGEDFLPKNNA